MALLMEAENERRYDLYEMFSVHALMIRKANLTKPNKRLKVDDFFKRPTAESEANNKIIDLKAKQEEQQRFISQFTFQKKEGNA